MPEISETEIDLLERLAFNDRVAFREIYNLYFPQLHATARRFFGEESLAEDLVQEVFVNLYQKRQHLVISTTLAAYLHTVLKYKILDEVRSQTVRNRYRAEWLYSPQNASPDVQTLLENKELSSLIMHAIEQLPPKSKEVFLLKYQTDLSNKMIAEQLQIAEKTVEGHISAARKMIKKLLSTYRLDLIALLVGIFFLS